MNKKDVGKKVTELLSSGVKKDLVFEQLSGQGATDQQLANFIATYADPKLFELHKLKVFVQIGIMAAQAIVGLIIFQNLSTELSSTVKWTFGLAMVLIPLFFAFAFYKNEAVAYNLYIILSIVQLPKLFEGFASNIAVNSVVAVLAFALLGYVWFVRKKLFPDIGFIGPHKSNGRYVFTS